MKLRLVSDGTSERSFLEDEHGNRLEGVVRIEWNLSAGAESWAIVYIKGISADISLENLTLGDFNEIRTKSIKEYWREFVRETVDEQTERANE
jgi:hypothetical protein